MKPSADFLKELLSKSAALYLDNTFKAAHHDWDLLVINGFHVFHSHPKKHCPIERFSAYLLDSCGLRRFKFLHQGIKGRAELWSEVLFIIQLFNVGELSLIRYRPDQSAAVQVSKEILNTFPDLILAEDVVIHYSLTGARTFQSLLQVHFGSQSLEVQREISEDPYEGWEELFEL